MVRLNRITMQGFKSFANRVTIPFPEGFNVVCGPNGSGKSCRGDTEVLLSTGEIKPIEELVESALNKSKLHVKLDDGVFTYENPDRVKVLGLDIENMKIIEKDVSAFVRREGERELYKITTRTGREVTTTGCHPVMVFRNGKIISEVVENLKDGDLIATPRKLHLPENEFDAGGIKIDEDFARFIGYLIGDGYTTSNRIEIVNDEEAILNDFEQLAQKFGLEVKYKKKAGNATRMICWSRDFPLLMKKLLRSDSVLHLTTDYKIMPPEIMFSKKSVLAGFLAGLFDCDATVRKDVPSFEYTTKNEKLANQVQLSLLRFGIVARKIRKLKHATNTKLKVKRIYFEIVIEGKEKLKQLYESVPVRSRLKVERLKKLAYADVKPGNNIDVLPQEVNGIVHECTAILGIEYKLLRKKYPTFASYIENRCCPTRKGLSLVTDILNKRLERIKELEKTLEPNQEQLIEALRELRIYRRIASKAIGLSPTLINSHWTRGTKARKKNIEKLYEYIKIQIQNATEKSEELIRILENLSSSDIFWDTIKINKVKGEKWVYDLTIPNCHNFIGNGIFVHNSNIVDAITFVLGTTSARTIRAQKLQNLLFNGGKNRKPADYCEASLYLDNADKSIPNMEGEVKITRKITRSGISVYKLDGRTVTRSRILDLLSNAKLSPEGYNIIMQGDVTRIIEMSPLERKGIIDEIAGIAEFDEKKEKAARELERVEMLVRESMIVVAEKQRLVSRLKSEKETAEKYKKLSGDLRKSRASLLHLKLKDIQSRTSSLDNELNTETDKFSRLEKDFADIENDIEEKEKLAERIGGEIIQKSKNYELIRNIDRMQTEILRKKDRIDANIREIARLEGASPIASSIVKEVLNLKLEGVHGTLTSLVRIPPEYEIALEVAIGRHANDIIVDTDETATRCIKFLKERRIGRARFIPLNRIKGRAKKPVKEKIIGYAIDLIGFEKKYTPVMEYVLGSTIVVSDIDAARQIPRQRIVTLDGDLVEPSGAMIGGYYKKIIGGSEIQRLRKENKFIEEEIKKFELQLKELKSKEEKEDEDVTGLQINREELERELENLRKKRKGAYEERISMQNAISKIRVEKAKLEAGMDNLKLEFEEFSDVSEFLDIQQDELQNNIREYVAEINRLGPINMRAIEEYSTISVEFEEMRKKLDKLLEEKEAVTKTIHEIEKRRRDKFMETFGKVSENFSAIYRDLSNGIGRLRLEEENDIDSGLIIEASPEGKNVINLDAMSGGEKTLTSLAFLFAIMQFHYSPFYILDEVDAALDKSNTKKIVDVIKKYSKSTQFIVITHNDFTVQEADKVFGVSMEDGASKVFGIELPGE